MRKRCKRKGGLLCTIYTHINKSAAFVFVGDRFGGLTGFSVTAGDVNNDSIVDLGIGSTSTLDTDLGGAGDAIAIFEHEGMYGRDINGRL
eukprot:m.274397 g.274397  ORF g.274397 m.274397 type:complete len:90 (+) comp16288_c1_seq1:355-624(+)